MKSRSTLCLHGTHSHLMSGLHPTLVTLDQSPVLTSCWAVLGRKDKHLSSYLFKVSVCLWPRWCLMLIISVKCILGIGSNTSCIELLVKVAFADTSSIFLVLLIVLSTVIFYLVLCSLHYTINVTLCVHSMVTAGRGVMFADNPSVWSTHRYSHCSSGGRGSHGLHCGH